MTGILYLYVGITIRIRVTKECRRVRACVRACSDLLFIYIHIFDARLRVIYCQTPSHREPSTRVESIRRHRYVYIYTFAPFPNLYILFYSNSDVVLESCITKTIISYSFKAFLLPIVATFVYSSTTAALAQYPILNPQSEIHSHRKCAAIHNSPRPEIYYIPI